MARKPRDADRRAAVIENADRLKSRILADAEGWTSRLLGQLATYREAGLTDDVIRDRLKADIDTNRGGLGSLPVGAREAIKSTQSRVYTGAAYARYQPDELLVWHAVGSNTCPDCLGRSGTIGTLEGWTARGLPRRGATVCGSRCRCVLMPLDRAAKLYGAGDVDPDRQEDLDRLTSRMREPIDLQQVRMVEQQQRRSKDGLPKGERVLQPGDFRQEDARRGGDARTRVTSDAEVTEAKLTDAAFRAAGRNPLDPMDVGRGDYATLNGNLRTARAKDLAEGRITDIDRVMAATPTVERAAMVDIQTGRVIHIIEGKEGSVDVPLMPAGTKRRSVSVTHFHPNASNLSPEDLALTLSRPSLREVRVYTPDGQLFGMIKTVDTLDIKPAEMDITTSVLNHMYREAVTEVLVEEPRATLVRLFQEAGRRVMRLFGERVGMTYREMKDG